jgi:hypothetical protein
LAATDLLDDVAPKARSQDLVDLQRADEIRSSAAAAERRAAGAFRAKRFPRRRSNPRDSRL